ncbi:hypothetical protein ACTWP4_18815 [Gracilibacillus sp. D59]|uniref:hypothetical protein n=1 Tax=Gracilibacillus sp. D59 TaxID=3457434 RepID=UPI003FCC9C79
MSQITGQLHLSESDQEAIANLVMEKLVNRIDLINRRPDYMNRKEFMEYAGIKDKKCNELFHQTGFPVCYELGRPRVIMKEFDKWMLESYENRKQVNIPYPYSS